MSQLDKLIDKYFKHKDLGEVKVLSKVEKSRTKVLVRVIDRGPGYDHDKKRYRGVRTKGGWYRGENREYGTEHEVHHKDLTKIKREED